MRVRFLGTGTSTGVPEIGCQCEVCTSLDPKDKRLRSSVQILMEEKQFLIDCTPDFRMQMLPLAFQKIDALLLTHEHYDHVGGIDDLRPFCRMGTVQIFAEDSVCTSLMERMPYCFGEDKYKGVPKIELNKISLQPFEIAGIEIIPIRIMHHKLPILGYRIKNFAYLTDIKHLPESEIEKLIGLDVCVISALRHRTHISHQTLEDALALAGKIQAKQTYFIHMSHTIGLHDTIQQTLPKNMFFAYDTLEIEVA